jgi:AhpC/TSA family protein
MTEAYENKGIPMLIPGKRVPDLKVETVSHGTFDLTRDAGDNGTLLIFYRGLHCPICIRQMTGLETRLTEFAELGVAVLMLSADTADRASETVAKSGTVGVPVGHGLDLTTARNDWGLLISSARAGSAEPELFFEPGHFYVAPDQSLCFSWIQSSPFARPSLSDILGAMRFRLDKDYPPRGMYTGPLPRRN